jgi:hypothetical protein
VSRAFTVAGEGPALAFVRRVPFSCPRSQWQDTFLNSIFEGTAA